MAAALGHAKKSQSASSPTTKAELSQQVRILRKIHSFPPRNGSGTWGTYELPNTHTCERRPPAPRVKPHVHTLTRGVLQVRASLLSLQPSESVFMLYPLPSSQTDAYQPLPVKLSGLLTGD